MAPPPSPSTRPPFLPPPTLALPSISPTWKGSILARSGSQATAVSWHSPRRPPPPPPTHVCIWVPPHPHPLNLTHLEGQYLGPVRVPGHRLPVQHDAAGALSQPAWQAGNNVGVAGGHVLGIAAVDVDLFATIKHVDLTHR